MPSLLKVQKKHTRSKPDLCERSTKPTYKAAIYAKTDLLILNDWGLVPYTAAQRRDMLELLDVRYGNRSTLVIRQMPKDKWHAPISYPILGDAILDRLVHNAYRIE